MLGNVKNCRSFYPKIEKRFVSFSDVFKNIPAPPDPVNPLFWAAHQAVSGIRKAPVRISNMSLLNAGPALSAR